MSATFTRAREAHGLASFRFSCLLRLATELTPYATMFRYPGEIELPLPEDAKDALNLAHCVFNAIAALIPTDARPQ